MWSKAKKKKKANIGGTTKMHGKNFVKKKEEKIKKKKRKNDIRNEQILESVYVTAKDKRALSKKNVKKTQSKVLEFLWWQYNKTSFSFFMLVSELKNQKKKKKKQKKQNENCTCKIRN